MFGPATAQVPASTRDDGRDRELLGLIALGERRAPEQLYFNYHGRLGQFHQFRRRAALIQHQP
jgi:hypothetical protein